MTSTKAETKAQELRIKYRRRMYNKRAGKPRVTQILMERTFNAALLVLGALDGIEWNDLLFYTYYTCMDLPFREIITMFESQLELAGIDKEKFLFGLHKFYENMARKLKKEKKLYEFGQFIGAMMQLQYEKRAKVGDDIIDAYLTLLMQTLEYLREDKSNLTVYPYGVSTDGEILQGPYPLADSDFPAIEVEEKIDEYESLARKEGKDYSDKIKALVYTTYKKYGYDITCSDDLAYLGQTQRLHGNAAAAMFPLINEYTFDMIMQDVFDSKNIPFETLTYMGRDIQEWKNLLKKRGRTLPSNGVRFEFEADCEVYSILMKEILYADSVHVLHKIELRGGCLSGYFDTTSGFLYSPIREALTQTPYNMLSVLLLALYASQVLPGVRLEDAAASFTSNGQPLVVKAFGKTGKIKDVYHAKEVGTTHRDLENYNREERQINVIIRNLPEGHKASEEAKALAEQYGYELGENQTFVRPFIKQVFVRKT